MQNGETNLIHRSTGPIEQMLDQCRREAAMKGRMRTKRATLELGLDVHGTSKQAKQTKQSTWPSTTSRVWTSWKSIDGVQRSWFRVRFTLKQNSDCLLLFFKVMHWPDDKQPKLSRQSRRRWWWTSSNVWPSRYVDHIHYAPTWATVNNDVCLVSRQGTSSNKQKWSNGDQKESCQRCRRFNSMWTPWQIHSLNVNNIFYTRNDIDWKHSVHSFLGSFVWLLSKEENVEWKASAATAASEKFKKDDDEEPKKQPNCGAVRAMGSVCAALPRWTATWNWSRLVDILSIYTHSHNAGLFVLKSHACTAEQTLSANRKCEQKKGTKQAIQACMAKRQAV